MYLFHTCLQCVLIKSKPCLFHTRSPSPISILLSGQLWFFKRTRSFSSSCVWLSSLPPPSSSIHFAVCYLILCVLMSWLRHVHSHTSPSTPPALGTRAEGVSQPLWTWLWHRDVQVSVPLAFSPLALLCFCCLMEEWAKENLGKCNWALEKSNSKNWSVELCTFPCNLLGRKPA